MDIVARIVAMQTLKRGAKMNLLRRIRIYLLSRKARQIRKDALHDYRLAMRRADHLERQVLRLKRLSTGLKFASSGKTAEKPAKPLWLPLERKHFTEINHQLVEQ
jgi:hypothetical protein